MDLECTKEGNNMNKSEIKASILETEHRMIQDCCIWESMDNDRVCLETLAYISGVNEMAKAMIEETCGDEDA